MKIRYNSSLNMEDIFYKLNEVIDEVNILSAKGQETDIRVGDEIKIEGNLGFLTNPTMKVIAIQNGAFLLESINAGHGGELSHLNQSWYGIDWIERRLAKE